MSNFVLFCAKARSLGFTIALSDELGVLYLERNGYLRKVVIEGNSVRFHHQPKAPARLDRRFRLSFA